MISITGQDVAAPPALQKLLLPVWATWTAIRKWRQHQLAIQHLRALDDRVLKDIGINRTEIMSVVCGISDRTGRMAAKTNNAVTAPSSIAQQRRL